jgi:phage pi2 protein 07
MKKTKHIPPPQLSDFPKTLSKEERLIACQKANAQWFKEEQARNARLFLHIDKKIMRFLREQAEQEQAKLKKEVSVEACGFVYTPDSRPEAS